MNSDNSVQKKSSLDNYSKNQWKVLELFSGIGGMHHALTRAPINYTVIAAVDINTIANSVYSCNYPHTEVWNRNIQSLDPEEITNLNVDTILMSPPCQPFTRVGKQQDLDDPRTDGFTAVCSNLIKLPNIRRVLMENVKGFETSKARDMFVETLKMNGYDYQEFLLNPTVVGVPNSRLRYFCIARRNSKFQFQTEELMRSLPCRDIPIEIDPLKNYLDDNVDNLKYQVPKKVLQKHCWVFDIVNPDSKNTTCFTKAYTHYAKGTGSIFCPHSDEKIQYTFAKLQDLKPESIEYLQLIDSLQMRYFTPFEVAKLMGFSSELKYPSNATDKQKYKLLGNSLNVKIVAELILLLNL